VEEEAGEAVPVPQAEEEVVEVVQKPEKPIRQMSEVTEEVSGPYPKSIQQAGRSWIYNMTMLIRKSKSLVTLIGLAMAGVLICAALFEVKYQEKAFPGVKVAGKEVEGMNKAEIQILLKTESEKMSGLWLGWGINKWVVSPDEIGLTYDVQQTADIALKVGRDGKPIQNWRMRLQIFRQGREIGPVAVWDTKKTDIAIAEIAGQIDLPAREPEIMIVRANNVVVVTSGENGYEVDRLALIKDLERAAERLDNNRIDIPIVQLRPRLSDEQVARLTGRGQKLIGKNLILTLAEIDQKWEVGDEQLITWLDGASDGWKRYKVSEWVKQLAQAIDRPAEDATFKFVEPGKVEEFKPAKEGLKVKQEELTDEIVRAVEKVELEGNNGQLAILTEKTWPEIGTGEVNNFGINERIGMGESWFSGSITNRIFNLKKAAEKLNGTLIPPEEVFSFNEHVGEVSADTGYKQAYIIKEGKTILGDGGGVCQVSTTLFRAVLNAGLPVEERTAHAYRVSYYEEKYQVGFDATVFQPSPDFKFRNDTPAYVLIQTEFNEKEKHLVFRLYGTSDGRLVTLSKSRIWEVTAPPPDLYIDDPTLPAGTVKQTEHAAKGSKVAFDWKVTRGEEILQERTFYSNYRPWQAVYLRGTKTN